MHRLFIKLVAAGAVVLPAVTYLGYAGMKDGMVQYHLPVDSFVNDASYHTRHVRLAGRVAAERLSIGAGRLGATFQLEGATRHLDVSYAGVVPDLFKAGCEVIVEGRQAADGTFKADLIMTKCASKYEARDHAAATATGNK